MEEFSKVRIGDLYVKSFNISAVKGVDECWRVKREITLINNKDEGIPILKEEAQGILKLLDRSGVLESVDGGE